ncbi:flagellar hook-associated protein FlgL [Pueribacillus theae]|uniref:Flagellar hook-associated protein FlgL n=1 Tax=Pueribacillus theae TaxID=2171751 RepID=A0A2U1K559_9BACI|nr:flagellar hook-associated protein FlgL [Pueribacillus theae]PWA12656.1 flagellar hook-associated protein FlgL [Pueribacillus theae]
MRVTQSMLTANMLRNLSNSYSQLGKLQEQLYTQRKISRPSDDPVVAIKGMAYRTNLTEVEQYTRNLSEMYNWIDNSEAGLEQANAILGRVRELVGQAANDTNGSEDRLKIKAEISQLKEAYTEVANTKVAGKYIFNGTDISNPPVTINEDGTISPKWDENNKPDPFKIEVSKGSTIPASIDPNVVFGKEVFKTFDDLEQALKDEQNIDSFLERLDGHINNLLSERAELGARYNRVELIENRLGDQELIAKKIIKENEGADMEKVITDLKMQETIHRAALAVGTRVIQPSLLDFLR